MSIGRNAILDYISQIGMQIVSLAVGIAIARSFNAEGKGVWQAVMMVTAAGAAFSNLGSRVANQYIVGKNPGRASQAHGVTILLAFISTLLCFAVGAWLRPAALPEDQAPLLGWAAVVLPLMLYSFGWGGILIGLGRIAVLAKFNFFFQVVQAAAWIVVLMVGGGVGDLLAVWALCWLGATPVMVFLLRDCPPRLTGGFGLMKENVAYGLTAFSGNFASNVMRYFNKLIILSLGNVGLFSIFTTADAYASKFFLHPEALEKGSFASVTATTREDAVRLVCRLVRLSLAVGLMLWIAGGILGSLLLWLNGPQFLAGIAPLWLLLAGPIANSGSRMIAMFFSGQLGRPRIPSMLAWIGAAMNVAFVFVGMKIGGMVGAAVGTSLSYVVHFGLYLGIFGRYLRDSEVRLSSLLILQRGDCSLLTSHLRAFVGLGREGSLEVG